jgi:hypothetical protein
VFLGSKPTDSALEFLVGGSQLGVCASNRGWNCVQNPPCAVEPLDRGSVFDRWWISSQVKVATSAKAMSRGRRRPFCRVGAILRVKISYIP